MQGLTADDMSILTDLRVVGFSRPGRHDQSEYCHISSGAAVRDGRRTAARWYSVDTSRMLTMRQKLMFGGSRTSRTRPLLRGVVAWPNLTSLQASEDIGEAEPGRSSRRPCPTMTVIARTAA